jgi:hypothetical protein
MAAEVFSLPVSTSLLAEVNAIAPGRGKAQDGTIGDRAHMERVSDHNLDEVGNTGSSSDSDAVREVHARDVDSRGPWPAGWSAERIVQIIVAGTRALGHAKRRVKYVIFNGRIWQWRLVDGAWQFVQAVYTGADQHREHFHVSFEYGSGTGASNPENNTAPWGILAAFTADQEADMSTPEQIADAVWAKALNSPSLKASFAAGDWLKSAEAGRRETAALGKSLTAAIGALATKDQVDEVALANALAPGVAAVVLAALPAATEITPEALTDAVFAAITKLASKP